MTNIDPKKLEGRLKHRSYEEIENELRTLQSDDLVAFLDSKATRVADTAVSLLERRREVALVTRSLITNRLRTALGRVRGIFVLSGFGVSAPETVEAYLHLLSDRSADVVSEALFGLVFMRRRDLLPILREHLEHLPAGSPRCENFSEAIRALEANDPSLFAPGFLDAGNVWRLNEPAPPYTAEGKLEMDGNGGKTDG